MYNPNALTETGVDNTRFLLKYLAKHRLIDRVCDRLISKDMDKIHISIEAVEEIQSMIKEYVELSGKASKDDEAVIACAHIYYKENAA